MMIIIGLLSPYPSSIVWIGDDGQNPYPLIQMIPLRPLKCKTHTHTYTRRIMVIVLFLNLILFCCVVTSFLCCFFYCNCVTANTPLGSCVTEYKL
jgi:hypothetical protein